MGAVYVTPHWTDAYIPDISSADAVLKNGTIGLRCTASGVVKVDVGVFDNSADGTSGSVGITIPITVDNDLWLPVTKLYKIGTTATGIVAFT